MRSFIVAENVEVKVVCPACDGFWDRDPADGQCSVCEGFVTQPITITLKIGEELTIEGDD